VTAVAITRAAQVLRPPGDGLAYLRHDRAGEMRTDPGSLLVEDETIVAVDAGGDAQAAGAQDADVCIDARGAAVIPGFVDCHTHLPFAGWREREYAQRVSGASYEEIARSGGGIRASARALAQTADDDVLAQSAAVALEMLDHGTTTLETKSGYGLSSDGELRSLMLAQELRERIAQPVSMTALLAHAVPDGYDADGWMDTVAGLVGAVATRHRASALDIYVESVAFSNDDLARMGELAAAHGLDLRAHVEQFSSTGAVPVAIAAGARSVDHLACLPSEHIEPLAAAETAAVLLPGAEFLGAERTAPARALADAGALCVLATDCNPGTSPVASMPLVIGLAVRRYGWTVLEALLAATLNAAWVLRRSQTTGSLEAGKRADVVVLDGPLERIPYRFGHNPVAIVVAGGRVVHVRHDSAWRVSGRPEAS
jgi:imidazolonepropionase